MKLTFEVEKPSLLRDFLRRHHISRRTLTKVKYEGGRLLVNGQEENVRKMVERGDVVTVKFPKESSNERIHHEYTPLDIYYEDDYLLVVRKPFGLATIPSRDHPYRSLASRVAAYYKEQGIESMIHIVTRLDAPTGGLVLLAKHAHIHHLLSEQIQAGQLKRRYVALIEYGPPLPSVIERPIGRKEGSIIEREVRTDGKYARTEIEAERELLGYRAIYMRLVTGRTHQIRVHLTDCGYPIVGDSLYGSLYKVAEGQTLLCYEVQCIHPITEQPFKVQLDERVIFEDQLRTVEKVKTTMLK
ncbi:RluA family pseudouridine synthase [Savagea sp. SN6]|uniref:RNA pseudouridylate synthase n=1 Tax=Savagea serpentis TaxID=2785297 RepID=A0A8J7KTX6_9BACL|nr:RluA family pseudouridine synthase [Savagea serpentis]MBF4502029.1 RluA family pseudouridine synthase [Savagea serpentis]